MVRTLWTIRSASGLIASCTVSQLERSKYLLTVTWNERPLIQESHRRFGDVATRADDVKALLMQRDWAEVTNEEDQQRQN